MTRGMHWEGLRAGTVVGDTRRRPVRRTAAEQATAQLTDQAASTVVLLHHRTMPTSTPPIDHVAIAPCGVWLVHSVEQPGRITARRPAFRDPQLTIAGHRDTQVLADLERQTLAVERILADDHRDVAVRSAVLFIDTEAPLTPTPHLGSYLFFGAPSIVRHLNSHGPLGAARVQVVADLVESRLPPA